MVNPTQTLARLRAAGVSVSLRPDGKIETCGSVPSDLRPLLAEQRDHVVELLRAEAPRPACLDSTPITPLDPGPDESATLLTELCLDRDDLARAGLLPPDLLDASGLRALVAARSDTSGPAAAQSLVWCLYRAAVACDVELLRVVERAAR